MDFLDDECAPGDGFRIGIELAVIFPFLISFVYYFLFSFTENKVRFSPYKFVQDTHQGGLVSDVPGKDHFAIIQ